MSMTRGEAIKSLKNIVEYWTYKPTEVEAAKMAIDALRPVSRERIEEAWRGEWIDCSNGWMCSRCECDNTYAKPFCPSCGAAMTDEAVDMMMKRLEEVLKDG